MALVVEWTQQHNKLLASLETPDLALQVRRNTENKTYAPMVVKLVDTIARLEADPNVVESFSNKPNVTHDLSGFDPLEAAIAGIKAVDSNPSYDAEDKLVRYRAIQEVSFGMHIDPPAEQDDREEFDLVKRKLERRISGIAGDPDTISAVAQRYFKFAGIRSGVEGKYRRNISKLINHIGDLPVKHVTSKMLREFRDAQSDTMKASSLSSVFTPIRGLFSFAIEEDIIEINPMASVQLQKEKRSVEEIKWKRFSADEMQRILAAMDTVWGNPLKGLSEERRKSIWMVCRVLAYSALRPIEVLRLEPEDVCDRWIKVRKSKTISSSRTIPLHPEIADFPAFVHAGGLTTFQHIKSDIVIPVRHNFERLIRDFIDPPITDERKVLYSFRSTFINQMRCAGADVEIRRAILGHKEAGALAHYDDGPQFSIKRKWVRLSIAE